MPLTVKTSEKSILVVDDDQFFANTICSSLSTYGYQARSARSAAEASAQLKEVRFDLVISDHLAMAEVRQLLQQRSQPSGWEDYVPVMLSLGEGLDVSEAAPSLTVDEFIQKPFRLPELILRVNNLIRVRQLHQRLHDQTGVIEKWSRSLEEIVSRQDAHLERLRKYVSPQVASAALSDSEVDPLHLHRRNVSVLVVDLKGFTAFSEAAEPEEVREVLEQFYGEVGAATMRHGGTIGNFTGDSAMVFFNDPVEVAEHQVRSVRAAVDIRREIKRLLGGWVERGYQLGCGLGVAEGYATIGGIGFQEYKTYTVIGTVTSLASRFCDEARECDIVTSHRFFSRVEKSVLGEAQGELNPRGIPYSIKGYRILGLREE